MVGYAQILGLNHDAVGLGEEKAAGQGRVIGRFQCDPAASRNKGAGVLEMLRPHEAGIISDAAVVNERKVRLVKRGVIERRTPRAAEKYRIKRIDETPVGKILATRSIGRPENLGRDEIQSAFRRAGSGAISRQRDI